MRKKAFWAREYLSYLLSEHWVFSSVRKHFRSENLINNALVSYIVIIFKQPFGWHLHAQPRTKRKLLQSTSSGPYSPLTVAYNGKICILFKAKRLAIRYRNNTFLDLTERVFGPSAQVDTKGSVCTKEKAMYVKILPAIDSVSRIAAVLFTS